MATLASGKEKRAQLHLKFDITSSLLYTKGKKKTLIRHYVFGGKDS